MPRATKLSYSVGQLTSILSRDAYTHPHPTGATNLQQWLLSGGPNAGIRRGSRTDVDLVMQDFIKKVIRVSTYNHYISGKNVPGVEPGTGDFETNLHYQKFLYK